MSRLEVARTEDFTVTGAGEAETWTRTEWHAMARVGTGRAAYATRFKVLYSDQAVYFLVECEDRRLTCTCTQDFDDLFKEDVVEVFIWPDTGQNLYFEYEISPLGLELAILVPNHEGRFMGWRPWHYEGRRVIRRATSVRGGEKRPMAAVEGWSAEFGLPFALFQGMGGMPPRSGTQWRANVYRIDYDDGAGSQWAWCERTGGNFHDFRSFGTFVFE